MTLTVLEVLSGDAANKQAKATLDWSDYRELITGQEYLAVRFRIKAINADSSDVYRVFTYWHLTLRYQEAGSDTWSVDPYAMVAEGYSPVEGEGWVFFLIRESSKPMLYFQPNLIVKEQFGKRTSGAYMRLFEP